MNNNYNNQQNIDNSNQNQIQQPIYQEQPTEPVNKEQMMNQLLYVNNTTEVKRKKERKPLKININKKVLILVIIIVAVIIGTIVLIKINDDKIQSYEQKTVNKELYQYHTFYNYNIKEFSMSYAPKKIYNLSGNEIISIPINYTSLIAKYPKTFASSINVVESSANYIEQNTVSENKVIKFCKDRDDCYLTLNFFDKEDNGKTIKEVMDNNRFYYKIGFNNFKKVFNLDSKSVNTYYTYLKYPETEVVAELGQPSEIYVLNNENNKNSCTFFTVYNYGRYMLIFEFKEMVFSNYTTKTTASNVYYVPGGDFKKFYNNLTNKTLTEFDVEIK